MQLLIFNIKLKLIQKRKLYDHHQYGFNETFNETWAKNYDEHNPVIILSSAGLIYREYGKEIIRNTASRMKAYLGGSRQEIEENVDKLYNILYDKLIVEIDAGDNGISLSPPNVKLKFFINTSKTNFAQNSTI